MKLHPIMVILFGLFLCSIGFNICLWQTNQRLVYRVQKLEAGPAKGLFLNPEEQKKSPLSDEQLNELLKEMLRKMIKERMV